MQGIRIDIDGPRGHRHESFAQDALTIGRIPGNDVVLAHAEVSLRHARVVLKDGRLIAVDLRSQRGTLVNGQPLERPHVLSAGDVLTIGPFSLQAFVIVPETGDWPLPDSLGEAERSGDELLLSRVRGARLLGRPGHAELVREDRLFAPSTARARELRARARDAQAHLAATFFLDLLSAESDDDELILRSESPVGVSLGWVIGATGRGGRSFPAGIAAEILAHVDAARELLEDLEAQPHPSELFLTPAGEVRLFVHLARMLGVGPNPFPKPLLDETHALLLGARSAPERAGDEALAGFIETVARDALARQRALIEELAALPAD